MNMDRMFVQRSVYSVLNFMSDIGGLHAALFVLFGFLFMFVSVNAFDNFLVSLLFRAEKPDGSMWTDAFKF